MNLAIIGLGKMGANMARRLHKAGHNVVVFNRSREKTDKLAKEIGVLPVYSLKDVISALQTPRIIWLMLPAGDATDNVIEELSGLLSKNDIVIDGGNSYYHDSIQHAESLKKFGIQFLDVGVSGGIWGLKEGYSLMIGGDLKVVEKLKPIFCSLAPDVNTGWGWVGPNGAGHYTKMVHNGIEYGMMESLAEGFELLKAKKEFNIDLLNVSRIWQKGSVVRSWLLDLCELTLTDDQELENLASWVEDSGEGRWTSKEALELAVPLPAITDALFRRFASRQDNSYALKLLSAMRNKFGGHLIKSINGE